VATVAIDAASAAVALAGRLAELGETRLLLRVPGRAPRRLSPRDTDLPGVMIEAMPAGNASLIAETLGIEIELNPSGPRPADARAAEILGIPR
jgi:hypothetical protein